MAIRRTGITSNGKIKDLYFSGGDLVGNNTLKVAFKRENGQTISGYILKGLIEKIMDKAIKNIKAKYPDMMLDILNSDPDISQWIGQNSFYGEIGLLNPEYAIVEIADRLSKVFNASIFVEAPSSIRKVQIVADFVFLNANDLEKLASMDFASFDSENMNGKTTVVPWLSWMLDTPYPTVQDHYYTRSSKVRPYSRTNTGIMVENSFKNWDMPSQYAGSPTDNFITRAVKGGVGLIEVELLAALNKAIPQVLRNK